MARRWLFAVVLVSTVACGGDDGPGGGAGVDATAPPADAPMSAVDAAPPPRPDADPGEPTATLAGNVVRSTAPKAGGVGNLFVAVFETDPVAMMGGNPVSVGQALIADADMSADDAAIAYEVTGIPVRAEPYYIVAFLDDNDNADIGDPENAGPDRGDLVSLQGLASPSVTLDSAGTTTYEIVLNIAMPF